MAWLGKLDLGTKAPALAATLVTLTLDGQQVTVPQGTSIMRAAALAGTTIPKLCASDNLEAFGSCRLCLVEIEGRAGYPASCTTPVAPDMVVRTQTPRLKQLRRGVMELYISDHPLDCRARTIWSRPRTRPTPISISTPPSASSARAACARATRSRAPSR